MPIPGSRSTRAGSSQDSTLTPAHPASTGEATLAEVPDRQQVASSSAPIASAEQSVPVAGTSPAFTSEEVRELVKLVRENDITELLVERDSGMQRLLIKRDRPAPTPVMMAPQVAGPVSLPAPVIHDLPTSLAPSPTPGSVIPDPGAAPHDSFHKVIAPMVGTFYSSPSPGDPAFVNEGDMVEKDQVIGIIEAMKIMNEIKSEHRGRCARMAVENGQPVEYGQTIMLLEPA